MTTIPEIPIADFEQFSAALLIQMRQIAQSINGFGFITTARRHAIANSASVPDAFLKSTAIVCDAQPELGISAGITSEELRKVIDFTRAFNSVADELELLARGLRDTVAEQRFSVADRALHVYALAKTFNRPGARVMLMPHLKTLKRDLGRSRTKVIEPPPETPATPAPPPLPPPPLVRRF